MGPNCRRPTNPMSGSPTKAGPSWSMSEGPGAMMVKLPSPRPNVQHGCIDPVHKHHVCVEWSVVSGRACTSNIEHTRADKDKREKKSEMVLRQLHFGATGETTMRRVRVGLCSPETTPRLGCRGHGEWCAHSVTAHVLGVFTACGIHEGQHLLAELFPSQRVCDLCIGVYRVASALPYEYHARVWCVL